ncbi:hypothetical protein AA0Z99_08475 [Agrococcus sp. 1P02AA]|uniref:hypothetical protein n=1 Tax=Agrococcus sp. 1P02AA TaxID=3132259 RepID=UPI0039A73B4C
MLSTVVVFSRSGDLPTVSARCFRHLRPRATRVERAAKPVERTFVPIAWPRMLTVAAVSLALAAAVLGILALEAAAIATLSLSLGALAISTALDSRATLRLLRSQRAAQQAGYERMRQILATLESLRSERAEQPVSPTTREPADARSRDVLDLIAGATMRARILLIGGPLPESLPEDADVVEVVEPGDAALPSLAHGSHTHVLIEPAALAQCDPEELRWLRRAFRWQHDTVIAIPTRSGSVGIDTLSAAIGASLATEHRDRVLAVWAPFGGGSDWGRA